ncbi:hypothetical protein ACKFKG_28115 [Phormidesmis sp. 146-35]
MDILIESTKSFEKDLDGLSEDDKATTVNKINECVSLFPTQKADVDRQLRLEQEHSQKQGCTK